MMILAILEKKDGTRLGTKSVPEDCLAVRYGGSTFVSRSPETKQPGCMTYIQPDTYHFSDLDTK